MPALRPPPKQRSSTSYGRPDGPDCSTGDGASNVPPRRRRIRHVGEPTYPHLARSGCSGFSRKRFVGSYRLSISGAGVSHVGPGWAWHGSIAELPLPGSCDGNRQLGRHEQRSRCGFVTTVSKPPRDHRGTHFIDAAAEQLDTGLYLRVCSSGAGTDAVGFPGPHDTEAGVSKLSGRSSNLDPRILRRSMLSPATRHSR